MCNEIKKMNNIDCYKLNHKKLLKFIKNENIIDVNGPMSNSLLSPPGSSEMLSTNKKKTRHFSDSSGNRSMYVTQVAADRALSSKRLDFTG